MNARDIVCNCLTAIGCLAAVAAACLCIINYRSLLRTRLPKVAKVCLVLMAGAALLAVVGICVVNYAGSVKLERAIARARAAGFPESLRAVEPSEDAWPALVAGQQAGAVLAKLEGNGASCYLAAFELYRGCAYGWPGNVPYASPVDPPGLCEPISTEMAAKLGEFVTAASDFYRLISKAQEFARCEFPVEWSPWDTYKSAHVPRGARRAARMLAARALHCQAAGEVDEALSYCLQALRCAHALREHPFAFSQSIRVACHQTVREAIEGTLSRCRPSEASLASCQAALMAEDADLSLAFAMVCEGVMVMELSRSVDAYLISRRDDLRQTVGGVSEWLPTGVDCQLSWELAQLRKISLQLTLLPGLAKAELAQALSACVALHGQPGDPTCRQDVEKALALTGYSLDTGLRLCWKGFPMGRARLRVADVALAVERYRMEHGGWPASLSALAPRYLAEIPLDPFDDMPIRYADIRTGRVVYSVGRDRVDSLGACWAKHSYAALDVTFAVFDPSVRNKPRKQSR